MFFPSEKPDKPTSRHIITSEQDSKNYLDTNTEVIKKIER